LIRYSRGKSVNEAGSIASGEIPLNRSPEDRQEQRFFAASTVPPGNGGGPPLVLRSGSDSVVDSSLLDDLAEFLAANYWPAGTHPAAKNRGVSTASLHWINLKYGGRLQGFAVNSDNISKERERVLRYVYMPSMIRGLYSLYAERFFRTLEKGALAQKRGPEQTPFTNAQMADMCSLYAGMARGLAACVRIYAQTPDLGLRIGAYLAASDAATAAYGRVSEIPPDRAADRDHAARRYQDAVIKREQQREHVAAAIRRGGESGGLDSDSLIYAAMWLYRRGESRPETLDALSAMFTSCAGQLAALEKRYRARPAGNFVLEADR
jgi:hypothetical protein